MAEQLCPVCYRSLPVEASTCPYCGADLSAQTARSYRDKLVAALSHPLDDVRMRAILALGLRGQEDAVEALVDCALRHPIDVVEGLAVVGALAQLGPAGRPALLKLAEHDPAHAVRVAARQAAEGH